MPAHLDEVDPEFAARFKEFKDANLLFDAMERNVWGKAMTDSLGLKNHYDANKEKYVWGDNVVAINVTAVDSASAMEAFTLLNERPGQWQKLNQENAGKLYADSGRFDISYFPAYVHNDLKPGKCTAPVANEQDGNYTFACVLERGMSGIAKSFDEAKGFVISDYQAVLEEKWIEALKKKYPVKMNKAEWQRILNVN